MTVPRTWSERDVEDWICERPERAWDADEVVEVIGRQILLGDRTVLDVALAAWSGFRERPWRIVVVEIKRDEVNSDAVAQLLGYLNQLQPITARNMDLCGAVVGRSISGAALRIVHAIPHVVFVPYGASFWSEPAYGCGGVQGWSTGNRPWGASEQADATASSFVPPWEEAREKVRARIPRPPVRLCDTPGAMRSALLAPSTNGAR